MREPDKCILGITSTGEIFRPSDWPERLCGVVAPVISGIRVTSGRFPFSVYARPLWLDDRKCVLVLGALREVNPMAYDFLLRFAADNCLRVCNRDELAGERVQKSEAAEIAGGPLQFRPGTAAHTSSNQ